VLIGDKAYWGQRTVLETRSALLDRLFRRMEIEKAVGMPMARNFPAIFNYRAQGWELEGVLKEHRVGAHRKGRLDQLQFGMTKAAWVARRKDRQ
jgi:RimJ/RimL family protein N-acetyltransferase